MVEFERPTIYKHVSMVVLSGKHDIDSSRYDVFTMWLLQEG